MKNIYILPTDKPSRLHFDVKLFLSTNYQLSKKINSIVEGRNIYITSDEEIKGGDWFITTDTSEIYKSDWIKFNFNNGKKIILTNDPELIKDGVQAIPDEFLEWFIKNPTCELIEYDKNYNRGNGKYYYKIITPEKKPNIIDKCLEINEFVSYQQALALKELGFDEKCLYGYDTFGTVISTSTKWENWNQSLQLVSAPLYQQGFRWFREKHGIFSSVWCFETEHKFFIEFGFGIQKFEVADKENTELECLKKLIEIVKEKK